MEFFLVLVFIFHSSEIRRVDLFFFFFHFLHLRRSAAECDWLSSEIILWVLFNACWCLTLILVSCYFFQSPSLRVNGSSMWHHSLLIHLVVVLIVHLKECHFFGKVSSSDIKITIQTSPDISLTLHQHQRCLVHVLLKLLFFLANLVETSLA